MSVTSKIIEAKGNLDKMSKTLRPINIYTPPAIVKIKYDRSPWGFIDNVAGIAMIFGFIMIGFTLHSLR